jgi:hypothetical protein
LEDNNTIYLGEQLDDSLANPMQSALTDVLVDIRPQSLYPGQLAQQLEFADGTVLPILFDSVFPYIPVRRSTEE